MSRKVVLEDDSANLSWDDMPLCPSPFAIESKVREPSDETISMSPLSISKTTTATTTASQDSLVLDLVREGSTSVIDHLRDPKFNVTSDGVLYLYDWYPKDRCRWFGGLMLTAFVWIWFLSLASWPCFVLAVYFEWYRFAGAHLFVSLVAYAPFRKDTVVARNLMLYMTPRYFKRASCRVETPERFAGLREFLPRSMVAEGRSKDLSARAGERNPVAHASSFEHSLADRLIQSSGHRDPSRTLGCVTQKPDHFMAPKIMLLHPHGILGLSFAMLGHCPYLDGLQACVSSVLVATPWQRLFTQFFGEPSSVTRKSIRSHLRDGRTVMMISGGMEEAAMTSSKEERIFLSTRNGIFAYALEFGAEIYPVYAFGESDTYSNIQVATSLRVKIASMGCPTVVFWGRLLLPWLPHPEAIHTVIGAPIVAPKLERSQIDHHQILALKKRYMMAVKELYEKYRVELMPPPKKRSLKFF